MIEELQMIYDEFKSSGKKTLEHLELELQKIRASKATPSMLQSVMVDYYGTPTPISKVANVGTMDARTLTVQAWEKNILNDIAKGIINANLGFAPQNNGEMLIINVPPLTEDRRRDLVKRSKSEGENGKVIILPLQHGLGVVPFTDSKKMNETTYRFVDHQRHIQIQTRGMIFYGLHIDHGYVA